MCIAVALVHVQPILFFSVAGYSSQSKRVKLSEAPVSRTAYKLLNLVGRGSTHIQTAVEIARAATEEGLNAPVLRSLASCGSYGKHDGNCERDLHKWLSPGMFDFHLEPYEITLNLQVACAEHLSVLMWYSGADENNLATLVIFATPRLTCLMSPWL